MYKRQIRDKEATYAELKAAGKYDEADKLWWEDEESLKKQSYYLTNLCGYSTKLYKPLKAYLDAQDAKKNGDILGTKNKQDEEYDIDNLDWLNDL